MSGDTPAFKRIVLELHRNGHDPATLRLVAEIAEFMHLDLFGRFVDDPAVVTLAGLPFAREFRVLEREWHVLAVDETSRGRDLAIAVAGRLFSEVARSTTIRCRFEVVRDPEVPAGNRDEDIVVVRQKAHAAESFSHRLDAAFERAAAVLIVPSRVTRRHGPVVAVAGGTDDPSIEMAAHLATAAGEALLLLDAPPSQSAATASFDGAAEPGRAYPQMRRFTLGMSNERLIVLGRGMLDDGVLSMIAARRGVPILVLGTDSGHARRRDPETVPSRGRTRISPS